MSNNSETPYVNGVFISEVEGMYGPYLSMGITEEGLKSLASAVPNAKGVRNFSVSRQKADQTKFSVKKYTKSTTATPTVAGTADNRPF